MANEEHVAILKQGVEAWNVWREQNRKVRPDLSGAALGRTNLINANLNHANLMGASLYNTNLTGADLVLAKLGSVVLTFADLSGANLLGAVLRQANLMAANLSGANLSYTSLSVANFMGANLNGADLSSTNLDSANLNGANLRGANLSGATLGVTGVSNVDLSEAIGIEDVDHYNPSSIGTDTLEFTAQGLARNPSRQGAVETFLRGAGVEEHMIRYFRSMIGKPIEFYSCFISYSHTDKAFARRMYDSLQGRGIRCWLDEHQMLPGDDIYEAVDRGIRVWDKVLLCCSEASLKDSWWVDDEIAKSLQKEQQLHKLRGKKVLAIIPLDLDKYLLSERYQGGYKSTLTRRLAADFTGWESDNAKFDAEFGRVVKALRADTGAREREPESRL